MDSPHGRALVSFYQLITNDQTWPPRPWKIQIQNRKDSVRTNAVLAKTDVWQAGLRQSLRGWQMGQGSRALAVFQKTEVQFPASTPGSAQPDIYTRGPPLHTHTCINKNKSFFFLVWDLPEKVIIYTLSFSGLLLSELSIRDVL